MSEFIIGVRNKNSLSVSNILNALQASLTDAEKREALFSENGIAVSRLTESEEGGMLLCYDGIIKPKSLEGLCPEIGEKKRLLQELLQDDMRGLLKKHGISAKLTKGKEGQKSPSKVSSTKNKALFVSLSLDEVSKASAEEVHWLLTNYWDELMQDEHDHLLSVGVMVSYLSCVTEDKVNLHMMGESEPPITSFYAATPMYGSAIKVEGMSEAFQEFWHLTYLLGAMGSVMKVRNTTDDADLIMKMNVEASSILAA